MNPTPNGSTVTNSACTRCLARAVGVSAHQHFTTHERYAAVENVAKLSLAVF